MDLAQFIEELLLKTLFNSRKVDILGFNKQNVKKKYDIYLKYDFCQCININLNKGEK